MPKSMSLTSPGLRVDDDVGGVDVLVDDAAAACDLARASPRACTAMSRSSAPARAARLAPGARSDSPPKSSSTMREADRWRSSASISTTPSRARPRASIRYSRRSRAICSRVGYSAASTLMTTGRPSPSRRRPVDEERAPSKRVSCHGVPAMVSRAHANPAGALRRAPEREASGGLPRPQEPPGPPLSPSSPPAGRLSDAPERAGAVAWGLRSRIVTASRSIAGRLWLMGRHRWRRLWAGLACGQRSGMVIDVLKKAAPLGVRAHRYRRCWSWWCPSPRSA